MENLLKGGLQDNLINKLSLILSVLFDLTHGVTHCFIQTFVVDKECIMWFLGLGLLFILLKLQEIAPVAAWPWWGVLSPLGLAVLWWAWADQTGYTKRKVVEKENKRKQARIDRQREGMGLPPRTKK